MKYLSTFSGIEAASVAWEPLGWKPVGFSEIDAFPSAVLNHHYPHVTNYGDITKFGSWSVEPFRLLVGGSPCQSFSVAGLRKGLADERGNLMLTFGRLAEHYRPTWLVWENVPGVLSSNGGRDFAAFLTMLAEFGYGFAYRVLDAQYFGVAQRRRRVFVVAHLGDWRPAAAVLFDPYSLSGNPAPSREKRKGTSGGFADGLGGYVPSVTQPITYDLEQVTAPLNSQNRKPGDPCHTLAKGNAGRAALVQPIGFDSYNQCLTGHVSKTIGSANSDINHVGGVLQPMAFDWQSGGDSRGLDPKHTAQLQRCQVPAVMQPMTYGIRDDVTPKFHEELSGTLGATDYKRPQSVMTQYAVRRLTPVEAERLQGFPDNYTAIPWRGKDASQCPDGPRYKALGNSMAVPVMRWIGERIQAVDDMMKELNR